MWLLEHGWSQGFKRVFPSQYEALQTSPEARSGVVTLYRLFTSTNSQYVRYLDTQHDLGSLHVVSLLPNTYCRPHLASLDLNYLRNHF